MPRLFVAIDFPDAVRARLVSLCNGVPGARWLPPEQFHLTLRFVGEVDNGLAADIADTLSEVSAAPFSLGLRGVGCFPPRGEPRVLWAGVEDGAAPARLHDKIEARLRRLGLEPDRRRFAPHVTLARLKQARIGKLRDYLAHYDGFATGSFPVDAFHLYSSTLGAQGAIHVIEASYALAG